MRPTSAGTGNRLTAIVLAAGGSSRLGRSKQLLRLRGDTLLTRAMRNAAPNAERIIVVLGADRLRIQRALRTQAPGVEIAINTRWPDGLASSLKTGLQRVHRRAAAVMILLVDQARLKPHDISRLVACWRRRPQQPAAARIYGMAGAPAIIPRRWFGALRLLEGDCGARQLLRKLGEISLVDMPAAAFDVDTPEDAAALDRSAPPGNTSTSRDEALRP